MKIARITLLVTAGLLALAACKREEPAVTATADANPLLAYVPGDTPYLAADLEPTPRDVVDAYLERFQPTFDMIQAMLDDLQLEIHSDGSAEMQQAALMAAVVNELDGKLNRAGLESLGLSLESHKAFYGMGVFPFARVALADAEALRAAIGRVEAEAGMVFPETTSGSASYYRLSGDDHPMGIYIAILPDHMAMGVFPTSLEDELLPNLLAQSQPNDGFDAGSALAEMNVDKGFLGYGSGFFDFRRIAAEIMLPESRTNRGLRDIEQFQTPSFDAGCVAEIGGLIDKAPRMVMGTTELTANAIGIKYQLEMEEALADALTGLVSDVPPAARDGGDLMDASLAIQAGRLRAFLLEQAMAYASNPFECDRLQALNQSANQALEQMNQPLPPFIGNLNGLRIRLQEVDFNQPAPETSRGLVVLEVEKPQMLVGSAQMLIPGLENLELEPGSDPVEVPQELMTLAVDGMHVHAVMSKDALGISMGENQAELLMGFLEADAENGGAFFSVEYDMAAQMQWQQTMSGAASDHSGEEGATAEAQEMMDLLNEMEQSYRDMLGRTRLELRFVPDGFEIHNRMTFN